MPNKTIKDSKYRKKTEPAKKTKIQDRSAIFTIVTPATALNKNIKWRSSDDAIVSVDDNGIITGNSIGDAVITAETEEGGYEAECHISVV